MFAYVETKQKKKEFLFCYWKKVVDTYCRRPVEFSFENIGTIESFCFIKFWTIGTVIELVIKNRYETSVSAPYLQHSELSRNCNVSCEVDEMFWLFVSVEQKVFYCK